MTTSSMVQTRMVTGLENMAHGERMNKWSFLGPKGRSLKHENRHLLDQEVVLALEFPGGKQFHL